jgi:hypothetical protein
MLPVRAGACRHLLAMSVAQAEAVLAAAACQPPPADEVLASTLLSAIMSGPAALAANPPMRQALNGLVEQPGVANEVGVPLLGRRHCCLCLTLGDALRQHWQCRCAGILFAGR